MFHLHNGILFCNERHELLISQEYGGSPGKILLRKEAKPIPAGNFTHRETSPRAKRKFLLQGGFMGTHSTFDRTSP